MSIRTIIIGCFLAFCISIFIQMGLAENKKEQTSPKLTQSINPSVSEEYNYGTSVLGFAMALHVENKITDQGCPVWVTVRIKNISDKTLKIIESNPCRQFSFLVLDSKKNEVPKLRYQASIDNVLYNRRLFLDDMRPGEYRAYRFNLGCRFDLTLPGTYTVKSMFRVYKPTNDGTHNIYTEEVCTKNETFTITQCLDGTRLPDDKKSECHKEADKNEAR